MRRTALVLAGVVLFGGNTALAGTPDSGIAGLVVAGPTCPVESVPPAPGCAPRPLRATVRIRRIGTNDPATSVRSGADGRFRVPLYPGTYSVRALPYAGLALPRPPPASRVRVRAGRYTRVEIRYDTGIR